MSFQRWIHPIDWPRLRPLGVAWLLGIVLLLASCGDEMRLHTGSDADLQRSLERILERLPSDEAMALNDALRDIVVYRMGRHRPETARLSAELEAFPARPGAPSRDYVFAMVSEIESDWARLRIGALRENAAALLDRRTIPEILQLAVNERERYAQRVRAEAGDLLDRARLRLADAERRLAAIRPENAADAAMLSDIVISGQALMLRSAGGKEEPILTFTLRNTSDMRPGRIHFLARVTRGSFASRERRAVIAHDIPGGLQQNATQRHVMNMSGLLRTVLDGSVDLVGVTVDLAPVMLEDARGRRVGVADADDLTVDRMNELRDLVARIEEHHAVVSAAN
jgi:hypothetical protein